MIDTQTLFGAEFETFIKSFFFFSSLLCNYKAVQLPNQSLGKIMIPIKGLEIQTHRQHNKCLRPNKINVRAKEAGQMVRCSRQSLHLDVEMPLPKEHAAL